MLRKILYALGLAKAPMPLRTFLGTKALFGTLPALGLLGWKYRGQIGQLVRKQRTQHVDQTGGGAYAGV